MGGGWKREADEVCADDDDVGVGLLGGFHFQRGKFVESLGLNGDGVKSGVAAEHPRRRQKEAMKV